MTIKELKGAEEDSFPKENNVPLCAEEEEEEDRSQHDRRADKLHPPDAHRFWRDGGGHAAGEEPTFVSCLPGGPF